MTTPDFKKIVAEKVNALREALEQAAKDEPLAERLLHSMQADLDGLESGRITPPYDISGWSIYVMPEYQIYDHHIEVTRAFGDLEMVLHYGDLDSYLVAIDAIEKIELRQRPE